MVVVAWDKIVHLQTNIHIVTSSTTSFWDPRKRCGNICVAPTFLTERHGWERVPPRVVVVSTPITISCNENNDWYLRNHSLVNGTCQACARAPQLWKAVHLLTFELVFSATLMLLSFVSNFGSSVITSCSLLGSFNGLYSTNGRSGFCVEVDKKFGLLTFGRNRFTGLLRCRVQWLVPCTSVLLRWNNESEKNGITYKSYNIKQPTWQY